MRTKCFAIISNSGLSTILILVVYVVNSPKNACKGRFCIFFYLHAEERGKTSSSFRWQTSFPPWPRGKGNCLDFDFRWIGDRSC